MIQLHGDGGHAKVVRDVIAPYQHVATGWIIAVGDNAARKREAANYSDFALAVVQRMALIAPSAKIGVGTVVMGGVVVQAGAVIGKHVILNTGCSVDHDCIIEDFAHIAPGAHLCGNVHVGEGTLVGVGVGIAPNTKIPAWSICKARRLEIEPVQSHC